MNLNFNVMLAVALAVLLGTAGARLFRRLRVPQVVAYIVIGVLLGSSGFRLLDIRTADSLAPLSLFALGITGFVIGGELKLESFRRYGGRLFAILLAESLGAFALVTALVGLTTGNWALALLLGAISSSTAPAATVEVLREVRALGVLTRTLLTMVALDNGMTLLLFGFASAVSRVLLDGGRFSAMTVFRPVYDIIGAVLFGAAVALGFVLVLRRVREKELVLAFALGAILLLVGGAEALGVNMILSAMAFGAVFANASGRSGEDVFVVVRRFAPPIYVLFFVLVGARLQLGALSWLSWLAVLAYLVARAGGKLFGVRVGARLARAPDAIRRYLGYGMVSQAGVAVGLAVLASQTFAHHPETSAAVVGIVTVAVFVSALVGPPATRYAVTQAGEAGRDVTEEDLLESYRVGDVMRVDYPAIGLRDSLGTVLDKVASSDALYYPVTDDAGRLQGVITLDGLRVTLNMPDVGPLFVAQDLMEEVHYTVSPGSSLREAQALMRARRREYLAVVDRETRQRLVGFLVERQVQRVLQDEIARRRGVTDH
ncbi:MAG: cation:proton antiporter [bacterium]